MFDSEILTNKKNHPTFSPSKHISQLMGEVTILAQNPSSRQLSHAHSNKPPWVIRHHNPHQMVSLLVAEISDLHDTSVLTALASPSPGVCEFHSLRMCEFIPPCMNKFSPLFAGSSPHMYEFLGDPNPLDVIQKRKKIMLGQLYKLLFFHSNLFQGKSSYNNPSMNSHSPIQH